MSGGQQQRIGVARALAADPDILLMDEPFAALDPVSRAALQDELRRLHGESGRTIVFVTHDMNEALKLATQIVVMNKGRIAQAGDPAAILLRPADDFVVDFLGREDLPLRLLDLETVRTRMRPVRTPPAAAVSDRATLREALTVMLERHCASLGVADDSGAVVGEIAIADIIAGRGAR